MPYLCHTCHADRACSEHNTPVKARVGESMAQPWTSADPRVTYTTCDGCGRAMTCVECKAATRAQVAELEKRLREAREAAEAKAKRVAEAKAAKAKATPGKAPPPKGQVTPAKGQVIDVEATPVEPSPTPAAAPPQGPPQWVQMIMQDAAPVLHQMPETATGLDDGCVHCGTPARLLLGNHAIVCSAAMVKFLRSGPDPQTTSRVAMAVDSLIRIAREESDGG